MITRHKKFSVLFAFIALSLLAAACGKDESAKNFEVRLEGTNATITKYKGISMAVNIPPKIDGRTVTKIGDGAFLGCTGLTQVSIPKSVKTIGDGAYGLTGLKKVNVPSSTRIGFGAFPYGCEITGY